ncbi:MAG: SDH family Clp fold serine proteinase [Vulcanimicrobiaceae bacterium]
MANAFEILTEIQAWGTAHPGLNPFDGVRKEKLAALKALTGRPIVVYAADFASMKIAAVPQLQLGITIGLRDKDYFPSITDTIPGDEVDLVLQSPGGSAEATEMIVEHLRARFKHMRVLIPGTAKSAATMLALCGNELVMDGLSECGPIDPQVPINGRYNPAGAILKQFALAIETLKGNPTHLNAWLPVLQMYGPALLVECQHHLDLSQALVGKWLEQYMFHGEEAADHRAMTIAKWLSEDDNFLTHARRVNIDDLRNHGVRVYDMATDLPLQDAVRELYYAIMATFDMTGCYKIFENSENQTFALNAQFTVQPTPQAPPQAPPPP